ncbi:MAG: 2-phosphosulfolactate phosphatase [Acidimicrobiia bacterium]|nr:2-phosphosulfolactate phosphatase [Acidimicrobiia bacterium]
MTTATRFVDTAEARRGISGVAIVVDVLRAFTTAAYAFAGGAERIVLVGGIDEAFALTRAHPDWLAMGEEGGLPIAGFNLANSPVYASQASLEGRTIVQRTSAGTQGVVAARGAPTLLCASMVCAAATARAARAIDAPRTYVITGLHQHGDGDDDQATAEYIEALIAGPTDPAPYVERIRRSEWALRIDEELEGAHPHDVDYAVDVDRFDFAMKVTATQVGLELSPLRL